MYNDDYGFGVLAAMAGLAVFFLILALAGYVLTAIFLMKIFDKIGIEGKWRAWVPVYNMMVLFKLGDLSPWLLLYAIGASIVLGWIPVLGTILSTVLSLAMILLSLAVAWRVGLKFGKDAIWLILYFFLSIVWFGILAFDKSVWNPNIAPAPWAGNAFLADKTVWNGIPVQPQAAAGPAAPGAQQYQAPQYQQPQAPQAPTYQAPQAPQAPTYQAPQAPQAPTYQAPQAPQAPQVPQAPTYQAPPVPPVEPPVNPEQPPQS